MKKWVICLLVLLPILTVSARASEVPQELEQALPEEASALLRGTELDGVQGLSAGISGIWQNVSGQLRDILRERLRGAVLVLLVVLLCGVIDGARQASGDAGVDLMPLAGALSVTMVSAGSLHSLMGLGAETISSMSVFSKALLPTLAAATASAGALGTATVQQVTTVFFVDLLVQLVQDFLLPLAYLYIGVLTAGAMLSDDRLAGISAALKKAVTWVLSVSLVAFTVYLSVARVISGSADSAAVKVTKAAISGAIPVVGGILSEASETVLAGAGMLKNTIGVFGMLAILAVCVYPFLQLGVQYLLYKLTAFLAGAVGAPGLCKLIDGLGGAFGLVLGMTGACALLLLVSVLSSVAAVTP
jgi:stage III sporulation protein AE